jgi:spore coat protein U-like protein
MNRTPEIGCASTLQLNVRWLWLVLTACLLVPVTATARSCQLWVTPTSFGTYSPMAVTSLDSTGIIRVICWAPDLSADTDFYTIRMDGGTAGDPSMRFMQREKAQLFYNLFSDATHLQIWGDGSNGAESMTYSIDGWFYRRQHTVYGRVFKHQFPPPGDYTDAVTVIIEY